VPCGTRRHPNGKSGFGNSTRVPMGETCWNPGIRFSQWGGPAVRVGRDFQDRPVPCGTRRHPSGKSGFVDSTCVPMGKTCWNPGIRFSQWGGPATRGGHRPGRRTECVQLRTQNANNYVFTMSAAGASLNKIQPYWRRNVVGSPADRAPGSVTGPGPQPDGNDASKTTLEAKERWLQHVLADLDALRSPLRVCRICQSISSSVCLMRRLLHLAPHDETEQP